MDARTSPWHGRRVLVTGCTGFLGRAVTRELLDRGANVVGLVRGRPGGSEFAREYATGQFRLVHGRTEDRGRLHSAMAVHEVSAVFHLAGTDAGPLLDAAAVYHPRIPVVTARPAGQLRLVTSDDAPATTNPVGTARFGELFGGGDPKLTRVVPRTVLGLLNHEPTVPADTRTRDFVFVRDAARACLLLAEAVATRGESHDCTFRSGCERTDQTMARFVAAAYAGCAAAGDDAVPEGNPLGWRPALGTAAALAETVAWYREFVRARYAGTRGTEQRRVA
jgi:nucleoside-diphosphate-sugar epimerase